MKKIFIFCTLVSLLSCSGGEKPTQEIPSESEVELEGPIDFSIADEQPNL